MGCDNGKLFLREPLTLPMVYDRRKARCDGNGVDGLDLKS